MSNGFIELVLAFELSALVGIWVAYLAMNWYKLAKPLLSLTIVLEAVRRSWLVLLPRSLGLEAVALFAQSYWFLFIFYSLIGVVAIAEIFGFVPVITARRTKDHDETKLEALQSTILQTKFENKVEVAQLKDVIQQKDVENKVQLEQIKSMVMPPETSTEVHGVITQSGGEITSIDVNPVIGHPEQDAKPIS